MHSTCIKIISVKFYLKLYITTGNREMYSLVGFNTTEVIQQREDS
jgi:hypothetical protein